ncbi:zinc finger, GRF-type containing protein [Tanacetum coccineum]
MVTCGCGKQACIKTSWTDQNLSISFYCCSILGAKCGFIGWVDPPMCHKALDVITRLLRVTNEPEMVKWARYADVALKTVTLAISTRHYKFDGSEWMGGPTNVPQSIGCHSWNSRARNEMKEDLVEHCW